MCVRKRERILEGEMRPRLIWPEVKSNSAVQCVVVRVMGCVCIGDTIRFTTLHGQHYGQAVFGDR